MLCPCMAGDDDTRCQAQFAGVSVCRGGPTACDCCAVYAVAHVVLPQYFLSLCCSCLPSCLAGYLSFKLFLNGGIVSLSISVFELCNGIFILRNSQGSYS